MPTIAVVIIVGYFWVYLGITTIPYLRLCLKEPDLSQINAVALFAAENWIVILGLYSAISIIGCAVKSKYTWVLFSLAFVLIWIASLMILSDNICSRSFIHNYGILVPMRFTIFMGGIFPVTLIMIVYYIRRNIQKSGYRNSANESVT